MGKAVIASKTGGLPEIVKDGKTGVLVPPGDAKTLAAAIAALSDDEPEIRAMGKAGRAMAETRFRPDDYYRKLMEIYESVSMGVRPIK